MSHFTVLVVTNGIGSLEDEVEKALYPFWELDLNIEDLIKDERAVPVVEIGYGLLENSFIGWKIENPEYQKEYQFKDAESWLDRWHGYDEVPGGYGYYTNPNGKWDWYSIGGRWQNIILTKSGEFVDSARKGDIDFEEMHRIGIEDRKKSWQKYLEENERDPVHEKFNMFLYGVEKGDTEESYVARTSEFITYAVLKDGVWRGRGDMGWWGISSNEKDTWDEEFKRILESIKDDEVITVVDCHI